MPADNVFDGPVTSLLSTLCILIEILSPAHAKGEKSLNDFKFGTFAGRFPSDGAASMAVKGLKRIFGMVGVYNPLKSLFNCRYICNQLKKSFGLIYNPLI